VASGFEHFGVGEAGPVIADFAEDAGSEHGAQCREAGDDRRVGVLGECLAEGVFEVGNVGHRGVQRPEMGQGLATHRLFYLGAQTGQAAQFLRAWIRGRAVLVERRVNEESAF
jgi:hypothetical protein